MSIYITYIYIEFHEQKLKSVIFLQSFSQRLIDEEAAIQKQQEKDLIALRQRLSNIQDENEQNIK